MTSTRYDSVCPPHTQDMFLDIESVDLLEVLKGFKERLMNEVLKNICISALLLAAVACSSGPERIYDLYDSPENYTPSNVVSLYVPSDVYLAAVNGESVKWIGRLLKDKDMHYRIQEGDHELVLYYRDVWTVRDEDIEAVRSQPTKVRFAAKQGHSYRITFKQPGDITEARKLADSFKARVVENQL